MKKIAVFLMSILILTAMIAMLGGTASGCKKEDFDQAVFGASGKRAIFIRPDGSVDPGTAPIERNGNTYTFTDDVYAPIIVDRDDVVIDGAGYTLYGTYNGTKTALPMIDLETDQDSSNGTQVPWSVGIDVAQEIRHNLTVMNLNIKNFSIGIWVWTSNNTITGNAITENIIGILLSASENTIVENHIANNDQGIFFGANQPGNLPTKTFLSRNGFLDNIRHLSGCVCEEYNETEELHTWDDGQEGNYWCDYSGSDADEDGIGDVPYVIDALNRDRYPLMQNVAALPTIAPKPPFELIIVAVILSLIAAVALVAKHRKPS